MRPLYQRLQRCGFDRDGRTDGLRPSRASPQIVTRYSVRCIKGYSIVVLTGTDARAVRPLYQRLQRCGFDGDGRRRALI